MHYSGGGYKTKKHWPIFIKKRIFRIEPPYIAAVIIALSLWWLASFVPGFQGKPAPAFFSKEVMLHVGYLNGILDYPWLNPVFWTLAIEFQFYLLLSIIFGFINSSNFIVAIVIDSILLAASLVISSDVFIFHYLGLFSFGIIVFQYRLGVLDRLTLTAFLLITGFFVLISHSFLASAAGLTMSVILLYDSKLWQSRLFLFLGSISYSLYLLHIPIGGRIVNLGKRYLEGEQNELLVSVTALLISIMAAYLLYRFIEKPSQIIASKYKYSQ